MLRTQVNSGRATAGALIWVFALSFALPGCGSSHVRQSPAAKLCKPQARRLVAQTLVLPKAQVITVPGTGNNAEPQCSFKARLPGGRGVDVTVNVDTSPQPYMVLARTIEERSQGFTPTSVLAAPVAVAVMGLGLEASWFPDESALMSTDGLRLVTVTVRKRGAKQAAKVRFATRISRLYLGRSKPSLARRSP